MREGEKQVKQQLKNTFYIFKARILSNLRMRKKKILRSTHKKRTTESNTSNKYQELNHNNKHRTKEKKEKENCGIQQLRPAKSERKKGLEILCQINTTNK